MKKLLFLVLGLVLLVGLISSMGLSAYAETTKTINVKPDTLSQQDSYTDIVLWHFLINQIESEANAPASIHVIWWDGGTVVAQENVAMTKFSGKVAHYTTTLHQGYRVKDATAVIYSTWPGNFNLSHIYRAASFSFTTTIYIVGENGIATQLPTDPMPVLSQGSKVYDTATIVLSGATGTVDFTLYDNLDNVIYSSNDKTLVGGVATSGTCDPLPAGQYHWVAVYSGNDEEDPVFTAEPEPFNVVPPTTPVPEVPAVALFALGLAGIGAFIFIKRRRGTVSAR